MINVQACFAGALFGVDAGVIGGVIVMPDFKRYVHHHESFSCTLTDCTLAREFDFLDKPAAAVANLSGNLVTTMQAGAIAGAIVCSPFADRWGRKPALLGVAITGFIGGVLQAFSYGHLAAFYIGRLVLIVLRPTYG